MENIKRCGWYNFLISTLAIIGAFYCIKPHFTNGQFDINYKFMSFFVAIFFIIKFITGNEFYKPTPTALLLVIFSGAFVFVRAYSYNFLYFTKWIEFSIAILLYIIILTSSYQIEKSTWNIVFLSSLATLVICVIEAFDSKYYAASGTGNKLILTATNQNAAAIQLLLLGSVFFLLAMKYKGTYNRMRFGISVICILIIICLIYLTGSRSSLLGILFIVTFLFMPLLKKCLTKQLVGFLVIFPLIFAIILVSLHKAGYEEITLLGRNIFNGRERMWLEVFEQPWYNYILGSYHEFLEPGTPSFQLHNGIVDMIASYGIIVTGGFLYAIYKFLCKLLEKNDHVCTIIVVCILAMFIQSTGEAALFIGNRCCYISLILIFANESNSKEVNLEENTFANCNSKLQ